MPSIAARPVYLLLVVVRDGSRGTGLPVTSIQSIREPPPPPCPVPGIKSVKPISSTLLRFGFSTQFVPLPSTTLSMLSVRHRTSASWISDSIQSDESSSNGSEIGKANHWSRERRTPGARSGGDACRRRAAEGDRASPAPAHKG